MLAQNVAPTLNSAGAPYLIAPAGSRMAPDAHNGILISDLLARGAGGRPISDPDAGALPGIALTAIDKSLGTWQYTLAANPQATDWINVEAAGAISNSSALLLPADTTTRLRFVTTLLPSHGGDGYLLLESKLNAGITFRAWDRTTGSAGGRANTSSNGGSTAFSTATETAATYFETRLFRSFNPVAHLNVYSLEPEFNVLTTTFGYEDRSTPEYTGFTIFLSPIPGQPMAPLYRMYYGVQFNPDGTETDMGYRYLTTNLDEARILEGLGPANKRAQRDGTYFRELGVNNGTGITGYIYTSLQPGTTEIQQVYRRDKVDKPNRIGGTLIQTTPVRQDIGDHVYTTKSDFETSKQGTWQKEAPRGFVRELTPYAGDAGITVLAERGKFESLKSIPVTVGATAGSRILQFDIDTFVDGTSTTSKIEDTLLVSLVSNTSNSNTLLDRGVQGTTLFTYSGGQADYQRGLVRFDGRRVQIDVSKVKGTTSGKLLFQVLNHDSDDGTLFVIHPVQNLVNTSGLAATAFTSDRNLGSAGGALNLTGLTPAPGLHAQIDNIRFDDATGKYQADLVVENDGSAIGTRVAALFPGLPAGVTLLNASGMNSSGVPYLNLTPAISGGGLATGASSQRVQVAFSNPNHVRFPIVPTLLSGPANRPPVLAAVGPLSVMPGGVLKVALSASDPDGDPLTLSLQPTGTTTALPTGGLSANGALTFRPLPAEVGTYTFNIVASDGTSQTTRQATLTVIADPVTTTRISGVIQKTNGQPLAGVTVEVGGVQGLTAANGSFLLNLGSGPIVSDTIKIRAELLAGSVKYPFIAEKLPLLLFHNVYAGVNNVIDRPIYLPALDLANAKTINPNADTNVTTAALPGVSVLVKAGTLMNQQGTPFSGKVSITEVPVALTPAALPDGLLPDLVVTIQPGEMVFAAPAPMTFPNRAGWAPGTLMDLWSINPVTGQFDDVGDMRVSTDGTTVETISGGVRNSSWHFAGPPGPPLLDGESEDEEEDDDDPSGVGNAPSTSGGNPRNPDPGIGDCVAAAGATSEVELHSGALIETHNLVSYQSQGAERGLSLTYDSLRADPRPIVHMGLTDTTGRGGIIPVADGMSRFVAELRMLDVPFEAPYLGNVSELVGLSGEENFWSYTDRTRIDVALQADLTREPSGVYRYRTRTGFLRGQDGFFTGTLQAGYASLISVNSIDSPFGAGWGLGGLQSLVETKTGVLLIDGDGSELFYQRDSQTGNYLSPPGDFSKLEKNFNLFRLTTPDQTVYQFNFDHQIQSITDRLGNKTTFNYLAKRLTGIVDPVGLTTTFTYTGARVTTITDPAGRKTLLTYDVKGNLTSITDPDAAKRTWEYDAQHHMTAEVDPLNRREEAEYGFHGRLIGATRKDGTTVQVHPTQIDGLYPPARTKDHNNPPAAFVLGPAESQYVEGNGNVTRTRLDRAGQAVSTADLIGNLPQETHNSQNLPVNLKDARGNSTFLTYDAFGNVLTEEDSISAGNEINASISVPGESDEFTFVGRKGQRIFVEGPESSSGALATITTSDGRYVNSKSTLEGTHPFYYRLIVLPVDDVYTLTITHQPIFGGTNTEVTGSYQLRIIDVDSGSALSFSSPTAGAIHGKTFYQFDGQLGQTLSIAAQPDLTLNLVGLRLFDPLGYAVDNANSSLSSGLSAVLPMTGRYSLLLQPFAQTSPVVTPYRFQASLKNPSPIARVGLDVNHVGLLDTPSATVTFSAPAGTPLMFHWNVNPHSVSIPGIVLDTVFFVPRSEQFTVNVYRGESDGLPDNFSFRLIDLSKAPMLTLGVPVEGVLSGTDRIAAYRFHGTAGQQIDLGQHPGLNYQILGGNHGLDAGPGVFTVPVTGEYNLVIRDSTNTESPVNYTLLLADIASAKPLVPDTLIAGQLATGAARTYFKYFAEQNEELFFDDLGSSANVRISIQELWLGATHTSPSAPSSPAVLDGPVRLGRLGRGMHLVIIDADPADRPAAYQFKFIKPAKSTAPLTLGQTMTSVFAKPLQTNEYTFQGTAGQRLLFDLIEGTTLNLETLMTGPNGRVGGQADFSSGEQFGMTVLPVTGTYRFSLSNRSPTSGQVQFRFVNAETAPLISFETPRNGNLSPGTAIQLYRLVATAGQRISIDKTAGGNDVRVELYDPDGEQRFFSGNPATLPIPLSGVYTLAVRTSSFAATPVAYQLLVHNIPQAAVTPANLDRVYSGTGTGTEKSVGTFTAKAGTVMWLDHRQAIASVVTVYDPTGAPVTAEPLVNSVGTLMTLPQAGTYTVKVLATGAYAFHLRPVGSASRVTFDQDVVVSNAPANRTDLYRFDVAAGQTLQFDNIAATPNAVTYASFTPGLNPGSFFGGAEPVTFAAAGTYYMAVRNFSAPASYGFRIHVFGTDPLMNFDEEVTGTAASKGHLVGRRINVQSGQQIYLNSSGGNWTVYDERHQRVADIAKEGIFRPATTGTYTIQRDVADLPLSADYRVSLSVLNKVVRTVKAPAATIHTYDPIFHQLTSVTDELGGTTRYVIDPANGNVLSEIRVLGTPGGGDDPTTTYTYTASGLVDTVTNPMGVVTDYDYDPLGRVIKVTEAKGEPEQGIQGLEYDAAGRVTATIDEKGRRSEFTYDPQNRVKQFKDALGKMTRFEYDLVGNLTATIDALGHVTRAEYDARDRLTKIIDAQGKTTLFEHDDSGNVLSTTDPLGRVTRFQYDLRNRPIATTDPAGNTTTVTYDLDGNLTSLTDALGNRTAYKYDSRGRVIEEKDPMGKVKSYEYDAVDNLVARVDRLGRRIEFVYDDLDRLSSETWVGSQGLAEYSAAPYVARYAYDMTDMLTSVSDPSGTLTFMYDERDRLTRVMDDRPYESPDSILDYTYDAVGNALSAHATINGASGVTNTYLYDAVDRLSRVTQTGAGIAPKRVDLAYDAVGQVTIIDRFANANGTSRVATTNYAYDTLNRVTAISHKNGAGSTLDFFNYAYDAASRITQITDADGRTDYRYDVRDQLTGADHADGANPDETYAYDATGNRTSSHRHGSSYSVGDGPAGARDNNRLTSDGTYRYAYDAEGNLVTRTHIASGAVRTFIWDYHNRLLSVDDRPSATSLRTQVVKYTYDAFGRRIAKNVDTTPDGSEDGRVTHFVYDGDNVLVELTDPDGYGVQPAVRTTQYLHGPLIDQVFAMDDFAGKVLWPLTDHLGTVHDLVNNSGTVVNHLKYDSFGNVISQTNAAAFTRYRFTGREFDAETGLQYNRARYYDPATGRFISEDPIGFKGGVNRNAYVNNNPVRSSDPSGMVALDPDLTTQQKMQIFAEARRLTDLAERYFRAYMRHHGYEIDEIALRIGRQNAFNTAVRRLADNVRRGTRAVCPGVLGVVPDAIDLADDIYTHGVNAGFQKYMNEQREKARHDPIWGQFVHPTETI